MTLRERLTNLAAAEESEEARKGFLALCSPRRGAEGLVFFVNCCAWTFDPRLKGDPWVPFLLFDRQEWYLRFTYAAVFKEDPETGIIGCDVGKEKSRDGGASWLEVWFDLYGLVFVEGYTCHYTSRDEELVEKSGDKAAYFWRLYESFKRLPPWLIPPGFDERLHRGKMRLENPANGSVVTGEAPVVYFASGGRYSRCVCDELSKAKWKSELWDSAGQSTNSRHAIGTPIGVDFYATLTWPEKYGAKVENGNTEPLPCFRMEWRDDPRKNFYQVLDSENRVLMTGNGYAPLTGERRSGYPGSKPEKDRWYGLLEPPPPPVVPPMPVGGVRVRYPWFEFQEKRYRKRGTAGIAQEVAICYEESVEKVVYAAHMKAMTQYPLSDGSRIQRDGRFPLYVGVDPGRSDDCALTWVQYNTDLRRYEILRYYECSAKDAWYYVPFLTAKPEHWTLAEEQGLDEEGEEFLRQHTGRLWKPVSVYAGHDVNNEALNARETTAGIWRGYKIPVFWDDKYKFFSVRVNSTRDFFKRAVIDIEHCGRLWSILANIRRPTPGKSSQAVTVPDGYIHENSHGACSLEMVACFDPHPVDEDEGEAIPRSAGALRALEVRAAQGVGREGRAYAAEIQRQLLRRRVDPIRRNKRRTRAGY